MTDLSYPLLGHASRGVATPINRIVIHAMGEFVLGADEQGRLVTRFCAELLQDLGLSAHCIVLPDGRVLRCVADNRMAYHAKGANKDSLGVEFAVAGLYTYGQFLAKIAEPGWPTVEQYRAGRELVAHWRSLYGNLPLVTHHALDPERKYDPGEGFDLARLEAKEASHG